MARRPVVCNSNVYGHPDYNAPLICGAADWRSSYTINYTDIKPITQEFERVPLKISEKMLEKSMDVRDDNLKTLYGLSYTTKRLPPDSVKYSCAEGNRNVIYLRNLKEKFFRHPPKPLTPEMSRMKSDYGMPDYKREPFRTEYPPEPYSYCPIQAMGKDEQPPLVPELPGYMKLTDIYLTTNRLTHVPFTVDQQDGIGRKNVITYYDCNPNIPKARGFGLKNRIRCDPMFPPRTQPVYDSLQFPHRVTDRNIWKFTPVVPHKGLKSETSDKYPPPYSTSDLITQINAQWVEYGDPLPTATYDQNLAPAAMYDTESCHIGTGWPVKAAVNIGPVLEGVNPPTARRNRKFVHPRCCLRVS